MDLAVKWRFFCHFTNRSDNDAERVYRWHIEARSGGRMKAGLSTDRWKLSLDDYVASARRLFESMSTDGFDETQPVPIDPNGELLDGSHRVACALALGIERVPVEEHERFVWAPAWDYGWFVSNGMAHADLARLVSDAYLMRR